MASQTLTKTDYKALQAIISCKTPVSADTPVTVGRLRLSSEALSRLQSAGLVLIKAGRLTATSAGRALLDRERARKRGDEDPFRSQHQARATFIAKGDKSENKHINLTESPLAWLARRKGKDGKPLISKPQYEAGERLREDFELTGLSAPVTRNYAATVSRSKRRGSDAVFLSDRQIDARRRFQHALDAIGRDLSDIVVRVCCYHEGMEQAERALGWPQRSGKLVLAIALDRLDAHYHGRR